MGLLERLVGADAARQFRERMLAASAAAQAAPGAPAAPAARSAAAVRPASPAPRSNLAAARPATVEAPPLERPLALADLASDFPTSILASAAEPPPPLLSAFANRPALLAALIFSEALAPPVALR